MLLVFLLLLSTASARIVWNEFEVHSPLTRLEENLIVISASSNRACLFDELSISWKANRDISIPDFSSLQLSVSSTGTDALFTTKLSETIEITTESADTSLGEYIQCKENPHFCVPTVKAVIVNTDSSKVQIEFDQDVSQPSILTHDQLHAYLDSHPYLEHEVNATWIESKKLELEINKLDLDHIVEMYSSEEKVYFRPRVPTTVHPTILYSDHNILKFRPTTHGVYEVSIINNSTNTIVSNEIRLEVDRCDETSGWVPLPPISLIPRPVSIDTSSSISSHSKHIIVSNTTSSQSTSVSSAISPPLYEMKGVYAVSPGSGFQLDRDAVATMHASSWSVSMWLRILEPPTGGYRPLVHKGKHIGEHYHRAISVWMQANSNHLLVQATTFDNQTLEFSSIKELEVNRWTLVTLVYHNSSTHTSGSKDRVEIYFDQHLDIRADFLLPLAGNDASLQIFQDHLGGIGPRGFAHSLRLYLSPLPSHTIADLYLSPLPAALALSLRAIDRAITLLSLTHSPLLPFFKNVAMETKGYSEQGEKHVSARDLFRYDSSDAVMAEIVVGSSADNDDSSPSLPLSTPPLYVSLLQDIEDAIVQCAPLPHRISLLALAISRGETAPLPLLARLLLLGGETVNLQCGYTYFKDMLKMEVGELIGGNGEADDVSTSFLISLAALAGGEASSLFLMAMHLGLGVGMDSLFLSSTPPSQVPALPALNFPLPLDPVIRGNLDSDMSALWGSLGGYLRTPVLSPQCSNLSASHSLPIGGKGGGDRLGMSPLCMHTQPIDQKTTATAAGEREGDGYASPTLLSLGLLYLSAMHNDHEAKVVLSHRYEHGGYWGVPRDLETSVLYSLAPVRRAGEVFHSKGGQPIRQEDRLTDKTEPQIAAGNLGEDDEHLALLRVKAAEGDPPALAQLGDYYYYGGGGLPRDQGRAFGYYEGAAERGHAGGMVGAANMLIKGEGVGQNLSRALDLYDTAASPPHTSPPALNGLGYLYFHGVKRVGDDGGVLGEYILHPNYTKAFDYFDQAGKLDGGGRGDALYNAGFMLDSGYVPERGGRHEAIGYYIKAARECGHFDAVSILGLYYAQGKGVPRSPTQSLSYLKAARDLGPWGGYVRRGLDLYLGGGKAASEGVWSLVWGGKKTSQGGEGGMVKSLMNYLIGGELGGEVARANALYVLRSKLLPHISASHHTAAEGSILSRIFLRTLITQAVDYEDSQAWLYLGHCFYRPPATSTAVSAGVSTIWNCGLGERGGRADLTVQYYTLSAQRQNPLAYVYLALLHHFPRLLPVDTLPLRSAGSSTQRDAYLTRLADFYYAKALDHLPQLQELGNTPLPWSTMLLTLRQALKGKGGSVSTLFLPLDKILEMLVEYLWKM